MRKRYYIAYGSNLSVEQMGRRCPDAKVAGTAVLKDWKLEFRLHANICRCKGEQVPVLVWEISEKDEASLDRYEGFPRYYVKQELKIRLGGQYGVKNTVPAMVYVMAPGPKIGAPLSGYLEIIREGYERFGFDQNVLMAAVEEAREEATA